MHFKSIMDKTSSSVNARFEKLKQYSEFGIKYLVQKKIELQELLVYSHCHLSVHVKCSRGMSKRN